VSIGRTSPFGEEERKFIRSIPYVMKNGFLNGVVRENATKWECCGTRKVLVKMGVDSCPTPSALEGFVMVCGTYQGDDWEGDFRSSQVGDACLERAVSPTNPVS
jgi:hypothetical protein